MMEESVERYSNMAHIQHYVSIEIPAELALGLDKASEHLKKGQSDLIVEVLMNYLEDMRDSEDVFLAHQEWQKSGGKTIPFDQVLEEIASEKKSI
jgi:predicted DNA-binding protein